MDDDCFSADRVIEDISLPDGSVLSIRQAVEVVTGNDGDVHFRDGLKFFRLNDRALPLPEARALLEGAGLVDVIARHRVP